MKKKQWLWIIMFIIVIYLTPVMGPILAKNSTEESYENRVPVTKPEFSVEKIESYPAEYEAYFNDNLPLRDKLILMNNSLKYYLFFSSPHGEVVTGKDGWLFYNNIFDDNCIEAYKGMNLFTEEELRQIQNNLCTAQSELEENGMEFVLFIAPNKERIYPEKMPDCFGEPAEEYRTKQLIEYLKENTDIRIVYPYDDLMHTKELYGQNIYYRLDTHWNEIGGYVGSSALLAELGIDMTPIPSLRIEMTEPTICDLADMLHMREQLNSDADFILSGYDIYGVKTEEHDMLGTYRYQCEGADERKFFMIRDSFADAMDDYLGSRFQESCMVHYKAYRPEMLEVEAPDVFVYELVERRINNLLTFQLDSVCAGAEVYQ